MTQSLTANPYGMPIAAPPPNGRADNSSTPAPNPPADADTILGELTSVAYGIALILPKSLGEEVATRALDIVEETTGSLAALVTLPASLRKAFFLHGPVRQALLERWHAEFSSDPSPVDIPAAPMREPAMLRALDALSALSAAEQRLLLLCRIAGMTQEQAAQFLGISQNAVSKTLQRADERLRSTAAWRSAQSRLED